MTTYTNYSLSRLTFIVDQTSVTRTTGVQIDWSLVPESFREGAFMVKLSAAALATATSISVDALSAAVPKGTVLVFGVGKYAKTTAIANAAATSIAVEALPAALADNDEAWVSDVTNKKVIPAGTILANLAAGKAIPRYAVTGAETATGILETTAVESDNQTGYGEIVGGFIYSNLLPDYGRTGFATWQGELNAAGVSAGFGWRTYVDSRAD